MVEMRDGFSEIVSGWMLVDDLGELDNRIQRAVRWLSDNRPPLPDEAKTIEFMIESGIARALVARGLRLDAGWDKDIDDNPE